MKNIFAFLLLCALLLLGRAGRAQSVGIGTPTPSPKAVLDLTSTTQGLLIPRLTAAQRGAIATPPQGLMVYQTDGTAGGGAGTGFWYFAGSGGWVLVNPTGAADNLGNHTATQNLNLTDKLLVGGTAGVPGTDGLKVAANGNVGIGLGAAAPAYNLDVAGGAVNTRNYYLDGYIGLTRGTLGTNNIFVGTGPVPGTNSTGDANTVLGQGAAGNLFGGDRNTAVGVAAGYNFKDAVHNTALGYYAGYGVSSTNAVPGDSDDNTFIGYQAAQGADGAAGTTALGANAGLNLRGGDRNTFVGNGADLSSALSQRTNATAIGYQAKVNQDNALVLGGTGLNAVNVGIGTTTPSASLDVARGTGVNGTALFRGTARNSNFNYATTEDTYLRGGKATSNVLLNDDGGNVGIGTQVPNSRLSISPAVVEPKITLWDGGSITDHYGFGISGGQLNYHVPTTSDNHVFYSVGKNGDGNELARFTGTGRLGVGTNAPFSLLANTAINIVGADGYGVGDKSLTWSSNLVGYAAAVFNANPGAGQNGLAVKVAGANAAATAFDVSRGFAGVAGASLLSVRANGYVGLGTANPNATLEVRRGTAVDGTAAFYGTTRTSHFSYATAEDTYLRGGKATSNVFLNDNGGNVGIGTTSVPERLSVAGTARADINNGSNAAVIGANANTGGFATGVRGTAAGNGYGVLGTAGANGYGVSGSANGPTGRGVDGFSLDGAGVYGETESGIAVRAVVSNTGANNGYAVLASATDGVGVRASATTGNALWATATGTAPAAIITQSGTGLALDVTNGAIRTKEVRTPGTGTANMLPVAYGTYTDNFAAAILQSSGNFTVVKNSAGSYTLTFPQYSGVDLSGAFIQVTASQNFFNTSFYYATASGITNGRVSIQTRDLARTADGVGFSFIMFKP